MRNRWNKLTRLTAVSSAIAALLIPPATATAEELSPLSVIAFPGTGNWPIRIGQEKGYFTQYGIEVNLSPTPNSVFQMTNLVAGKFGHFASSRAG